MRPINRGSIPLTTAGQPVVFKKYKRALRHLIDRMGSYCSYCESRLPSSLAVEHMQPKSLNPALETTWDNFLLGCVNCNSTKGAKEINLDDYFFPDTANTFMAFLYDDDIIVKPNHILSAQNQSKAKNTIKLVGLDVVPPKRGTIKYEEATDRRFEHRKNAWDTALDTLNDYSISNHKPTILKYLKIIVKEQGHWSIWMTVFQNYPEVKQALIQETIGTASNCFDHNFKAIPRNGIEI